MKLIVKLQIRVYEVCILEKSKNSEDRLIKSYVICTWKRKNEFESYFKCFSSFDSANIRNCKQVIKPTHYQYSYWDHNTTKRFCYMERTYIN